MRKPRSSDPTCLFAHIADLFQDAVWRPAADVYRTGTNWLVKFDLAGVNLDEVRIKVCGRWLSIQGVRRDSCLEQDSQYHSLEIAYSEFERRIELPVNLERARISTDYQAGMLLVRIWTEESP
jgi:HSP20 family protein